MTKAPHESHWQGRGGVLGVPSEWRVALAAEPHAGPPPVPHSSCRHLPLPREPRSALRLPWEDGEGPRLASRAVRRCRVPLLLHCAPGRPLVPAASPTRSSSPVPRCGRAPEGPATRSRGPACVRCLDACCQTPRPLSCEMLGDAGTTRSEQTALLLPGAPPGGPAWRWHTGSRS